MSFVSLLGVTPKPKAAQHVAAFKSIDFNGNYTNIFSSAAGNTTSLLIPRDALPDTIRNPMLEIEITSAGGPVILADVFNWFSQIDFLMNNVRVGTMFPTTTWFSTLMKLNKNKFRSTLKSYGIDSDKDNYLNMLPAFNAGTVKKFYLPLDIWLPHNTFVWHQNFVQGSLQLQVKTNSPIVGGNGTITCTALKLFLETPVQVAGYNDSASLVAKARIGPQSARFLDHFPVINNQATVLTAAATTMITLPQLEGECAFLLMAIRDQNYSNALYASNKFYNVGHERGSAIDFQLGATSILGNGQPIRTDFFTNMFSGQWFNNDVLSQKNLMIIPFCELVGETLEGRHTGSKYFNSQSGHKIALTLPSAPTSEVQTVTQTGVPASGYYRMKYRGVESEPIAYNSSVSIMKNMFEGISTVLSRNITVTFSAAIGNGVTATYSHPETSGLEGYKIEIVDSNMLTAGGVQINTTTSITTAGTAGIATGTYAVDVWAFNYRVVEQDTKGSVTLKPLPKASV